MSNFGPAPSRMTRKISPSVVPRSHFASVRSDGCVPSGAIGPLPFASAPWQKRQFFWNSAWPALIDSGDEATGFFIFLPASLPPGFCAATSAPPRTNAAQSTDRRRMIRESPVVMEAPDSHIAGTRAQQISAPLGRVVAVPDPPFDLEARHEDGEHFEEADERID